MKIELEIPDELVDEKVLWLFAGNENIAIWRKDRGWVIKESLCSMCGMCCSESHVAKLGLLTENGFCIFLKDHPTEEGKKWCSLGAKRPFVCAIGAPRFEPRCTVRWKDPT